MRNIKISKSTKGEIVDFDKQTWHGEDIEHYGEPVKWVEKEFFYKATDNGKIVGTAKGKFEAGIIYLQTIIVSKKHRKKSIGKMLIEEIVRWGKNLCAHKIILFTMEEWEASKFYQKLGFEKTGSLPHHYLKRDFAIYSKSI